MAYVIVQKRVHLTTRGAGGATEAERTRFAWISVYEKEAGKCLWLQSRRLNDRIHCKRSVFAHLATFMVIFGVGLARWNERSGVHRPRNVGFCGRRVSG
jgi:hypothetical protein